MRRNELAAVITLPGQDQSGTHAGDATDLAESEADEMHTATDVTRIDEHGHWSLDLRDTILTASGGDDSGPDFYTTGSPKRLRAVDGEYECAVPEVVHRYINESATTVDEAALMDAVEDELAAIYTDEDSLRYLYSCGLSQAQIARQLGCETTVITAWMQRHGILTGEHSEHYSLKGEPIDIDQDEGNTDDDDDTDDWSLDEETLRALANEGLSLAAMAERLDEPTHVVYIQLDRHDIGDWKSPEGQL